MPLSYDEFYKGKNFHGAKIMVAKSDDKVFFSFLKLNFLLKQISFSPWALPLLFQPLCEEKKHTTTPVSTKGLLAGRREVSISPQMPFEFPSHIIRSADIPSSATSRKTQHRSLNMQLSTVVSPGLCIRSSRTGSNCVPVITTDFNERRNIRQRAQSQVPT